MPVATPIEVRQLGIALESVRGTVPAAPTKFFSLTKDSDIDNALKVLSDPALRGYNSRGQSFPGPLSNKGPFKTPVRASDIYYWLKMVFGAPSSTEQASWTVVTGSNDTIDFNIGAGALVATIAAGTYIAGQTQADATSFCKAVYDAIHAAEAAGTYTVTYSRTTGLFTVTRSAGTFQMKFLTGPNTAKNAAALLGFTVTDQTGALNYTGSVVQNAVFKHTFTQGQITQLPAYSFYINRGFTDAAGNTVKSYPIGSVEKLKISSTNESPLEMDATVVAQQEKEYAGAWTPVYSESGVLMFNQTTVKIAGVTPAVPYVKHWSVEHMPGLKEYRPLSTFQYPYDILAAGPFAVAGDAEIYFMDEVERNKFLAETLTSLEFLTVGGAITGGGGGSNKYTLDLAFANVEYEKFPFGEIDGFLAGKVKWRAAGVVAGASYTALATAYVINTVVPGT